MLLHFFTRKLCRYDGQTFLVYLIWYGSGRFFIESLRTDQLTIANTGIAATQVVCILLIIGGLTGIIRGRRKAGLAESD